MNQFPAALALAVALPALSAASDFAPPGLSLEAIRARTTAQKQIPQRRRVMGASRPGGQAAGSVAPDVSAYPVRGIDVSHYDGAIDWNTVAKDGLSFVYIKATEGGTVTDAKFADNWKGASGAGLLKGAYHFYDFCDGGAAQADNFIKTVPVVRGALPPTIDLEESDDCKKMPTKAAFLAQMSVFVQKVQDAYGTAPILYVNAAIYNEYLSGVADSYLLWIADISHAAPAMPNGADWAMWQYGWHGKVSGIADEVDLDVFKGTSQQLASLAGAGAGTQVADSR